MHPGHPLRNVRPSPFPPCRALHPAGQTFFFIASAWYSTVIASPAQKPLLRIPQLVPAAACTLVPYSNRLLLAGCATRLFTPLRHCFTPREEPVGRSRTLAQQVEALLLECIRPSRTNPPLLVVPGTPLPPRPPSSWVSPYEAVRPASLAHRWEVSWGNKWKGKQRQLRAPSPDQTVSRGVQILKLIGCQSLGGADCVRA
jgi:hypothetical protein